MRLNGLEILDEGSVLNALKGKLLDFRNKIAQSSWPDSLKELVTKASELHLPLLQNSEITRNWWNELFGVFNIPQEASQKVLHKIVPLLRHLSPPVKPESDKPALPKESIGDRLAALADLTNQGYRRQLADQYLLAQQNTRIATTAIRLLTKQFGVPKPVPVEVVPEHNQEIDNQTIKKQWSKLNRLVAADKKNVGKAKQWVYDLHKKGINLTWQGRRTPDHPLGDLPPLIARVEQTQKR